MERIPSYRFAEAIGEGLSRLPQGMQDRLGHVHFFCGVDPVFAGLHSYVDSHQGAYRDVAHCCYPFNLLGPRDRRTTTVVLPTADVADPVTVVHELGHALHLLAGFDHVAAPVTEYATTNHYEAFADALVAWTHWYGDRDVAGRDYATIALFEELAV